MFFRAYDNVQCEHLVKKHLGRKQEILKPATDSLAGPRGEFPLASGLLMGPRIGDVLDVERANGYPDIIVQAALAGIADRLRRPLTDQALVICFDDIGIAVVNLGDGIRRSRITCIFICANLRRSPGLRP